MNSKTFLIFIVFLLLGIAGYSQVINLDATTTGSTITTCNATLYDSGGSDGNYSANENYEITFCSELTGQRIIVEVVLLNTESESSDYIRFFDGANTSTAPIIATFGGGMPDQTEYETSGSCVTIQWHSDGSVQRAGFALGIRCIGLQCQDYTVAITADAQYDATAGAYIGCPGNTTILSAQVDFPNNNDGYEQTIDNTTFLWSIRHDSTITYSGLGLDEQTLTLEPGGYIVGLTATDVNGCQENMETNVYVSMTPTFIETAVPSNVCSGSNVELHGAVVPPDEWRMPLQTINQEQHCFSDAVNLERSICFPYFDFPDDLTITSESDIVSICIEIEHSYIGDLEIWITCPSGNRMDLFDGYNDCRSCTLQYWGEPVDDGNDDCIQGTPYHYCWNQTATQTIEAITENAPTYTYTNNNGQTYTNHEYIPAGDYLPRGNWSSLVGCPLNGEWCITFVDHLQSDDGVLFSTELTFADYIIRETPIIFQNTYGNEMWWEGDGLQTAGFAADNTANITTPGTSAYTFHATDNFGCTYDTTLYVTMYEVPTANLNMNIGDTIVCGNTFEHLQAEDPGEYSGYWYEENPSTLFGDDNELVNNISATATVEEYGRHDFYWIAQNGPIENPNVCRDTAGPWTVNFLQRPNAQIAEDDFYICGYSGQLTAGYDIGEGIWSTSTGLVSFDNASSPTTNVSTTELNTGNAEHPYYQLYWTVRNTELCTDVDSIRVMFVSAPTANFNMNIGDTIACGNTFEHLQAEELGDSFAGYWYEANSSTQFGDDNSLYTSASTIATVEDYGRHDFYWIVYNELVDNPNSCRDTAGPWTVNFLQPPTAHITENEFVFCGNSGQLTADYDSIYGGMWVSDASSLVSFDNASSPTTTVSTTELNTGNTEHPYYMLYWTVQNTEFCANTDSARVIFKRKPSSEFSVIPPKCFGESAIIIAAEDSLPLYNWDFDNGLTTSITANAASGYYKALIFWDNQEPSHTVVLSTTDSYGCHSDITQITIDEPYRPEYSYIIYGDTCAMGKGGIELTDETGYYTFFWLDNSENSANATGYDHETGVITDSHVYNLPAGTYTYHTQYQTFNSDYTQSYQQYFHDINCHSYPEIEISVIGKIMAGIALSEDIDIGSIATPNADVVFVNTTDYDSIYNTICDWNFGDGSTASTCDELVEHTYLEPCRYFPYLVVHNRDLPECRDTAFFELAVNKRIDTVVNTPYFEYEWHTYYVSGEYLINMHSDNGCSYILILNITLPNDVAEYEKYGIDIYPNPTENFLRIISEMKMSAVEIISATGQLVMSSETNDSCVDFDVSSLNDGVYFVRIYGEDNVAPIVQKFIKE
ncbi:MAG: T9SS type A sorting domain-containing protein [Bacteroidales bacterium]|nr:T9SS type A sorting domain-containing protein [Bacteroidales bacterium]